MLGEKVVKYVYRCRKCGVEWTEEQKISDNPLDEHRKCGGIADRIIQNVHVNTHFKGSHNLQYRKK